MTFAITHWRLILEGFVVAILGIMLLSAQGNARHYRKLWEGEKTARALEQAEIRKVRAEQKAADAEHARQIELTQVKVSQEISGEYQARLSALRARYDSLRAGSTSAASSGSRGENVPSVPGPASGPDDTAADYAFRCEADAIQLESLQGWIRGQVAIPR